VESSVVEKFDFLAFWLRDEILPQCIMAHIMLCCTRSRRDPHPFAVAVAALESCNCNCHGPFAAAFLFPTRRIGANVYVLYFCTCVQSTVNSVHYATGIPAATTCNEFWPHKICSEFSSPFSLLAKYFALHPAEGNFWVGWRNFLAENFNKQTTIAADKREKENS